MASPQHTTTANIHGRGSLRTDLGLVAMVTIWAVNFSVIKLALAELHPLAVNGLRYPLAGLAMYLILRRQGPIALPRAADRARIFGLGLIGNIIYQLLFIFGIDRTSAGNASLLLAGTPIITALLSARLGHERVSARVWLAVIGTFGGIALVVLGGARARDGGASVVGDLIMLGASVSWALYTVGARDPIARYGPLAVTAWTLWIGAAGLVVIGLPEILAADLSAVTPRAWAATAYAGVLSIGVAYLLWYQGVARLGNTRTASYSQLVPVLTLAVAWPVLGEIPTPWQLLGAAIIITGVTLARRSEVPRILDATSSRGAAGA